MTVHPIAFAAEDAAYLTKRAVPLEFAVAAGLRSLDSRTAGHLLGRPPVEGGGLGIPYPGVEPEYWRVRLRQGDVRFLAPAGREVPVYCPLDVPLLDDLRTELCVVEGPIKALALFAKGIPAVGLGGTGTTLTTKASNRILNDSWMKVLRLGRSVVLLFDSGRTANPNVARDEARLVLALETAGVSVRVAQLPSGERGVDWGPDDFLAARGVDELRQIIGSAVPGEPLSRVAQIADLDEAARTTEAAKLLSDLPFMASVVERRTAMEVAVGHQLRLLGIPAGAWKDALREQKARSKSATRGTPAQARPSGGAGSYVMEGGRTCRRTVGPDGAERLEEIANFEARIVEDRLLDDGLTGTRRFILVGVEMSGRPLPRVELAPADFEKQTWPLDRWGATAQLSPERSAASHLRKAIQMHSTPSRITAFVHTGWREIDGEQCFLHAGGCVGPGQATVLLNGPIERYRLPSSSPDLQRAIQITLDFTSVAERQVTLPLLCSVFRAPLQSVRPAPYTVWLYGPSGSLKSTLSALALSFYGEAFDATNLPLDWGATAAAIEHRLFLMKDVLAVIDDFAPRSADPTDELRRKADVVLRSIGNQSARGRMRADMTAQRDHAPRALVISTGEDVPTGESILARILAVRVERGSVDLRLLTKLQGEKRLLPQVMTAYLEWLRSRHAGLSEMTRQFFDSHFKRFSGGPGHLRSPTALANLAIGADFFAAFARDGGFFTQEESSSFVESAVEALMELTGEQAAMVGQADPAERFLSVLESLLAQGRAALSDALNAQLTLIPGVEPIGWKDERVAYLLPEATYRIVVRAIRESGGAMPLSEPQLWARVQRRGDILEAEEGRTTKKKHLGGARQRVVFMRLEAVLPTADGPDEPACAPTAPGAPQ